MSENGVIYTADKNFTLPPAVTAVTNSTSDRRTALVCADHHYHQTEPVGVESIIGYIMMHIVQYELSSSSSRLQASVVLHLVLTKSESSE